MINRPFFHLFLSLSVLAILVGILFVIFTQFDRGYVAPIMRNNDQSKQQELIQQIVAKTKPGKKTTLDTTANPSADQSVMHLIEQVKKDDKESELLDEENPQTETGQALERIKRLNQEPYSNSQRTAANPYSSYSYQNPEQYWLMNNPWSPYYDPNRR
jgi:hypothetical protein